MNRLEVINPGSLSLTLAREGGGANQLAFRAVAFAAAKVFTKGVKLTGVA